MYKRQEYQQNTEYNTVIRGIRKVGFRNEHAEDNIDMVDGQRQDLNIDREVMTITNGNCYLGV